MRTRLTAQGMQFSVQIVSTNGQQAIIMQAYNCNQLHSSSKTKSRICVLPFVVFVTTDGAIIGKDRKKGRNLSLPDTGDNTLESCRG